MSLSCEGLGWSVRARDVVTDVSLALVPGETLGLIGPNGSGKSTLLKMLAGLRRPRAGHVALDGTPMSGLTRRDIALAIAFVEQQAETGDRITVRDAVELGRTPWLSALRRWGEDDDAAVARALAAVGMAACADRYWHTLSGGERQRVHIARALAQTPRVLLLDEPTNHLDIRHQLSILSLVRALDVTSVIALHDLNQARDCDRVGVMDGGRLVALGPPAHVLTSDRLERTFAVAARTIVDPVDGTRILHFMPLPAQIS